MPEATPGYLYILRSLKSGKHYLGSTIRLEGRLEEHNTGQVSGTRNKGPWAFACIVEFESPSKARSAEQWLKRIHRKDVIEAIVSRQFTWPPERNILGYMEPEATC